MGSGIERLDPRNIQEQLAEFRLGEPASEGRRPFQLIFAATSSSRRENLIKTVAIGLPVLPLPLGEDELASTRTERVVRDKLKRARIIVTEARETGIIPQGLRVAIIAADTQSGPAALNRKGELILKHQSKPRSEADVMRVLRQMRRAAESGEDPLYEVTSASGIAYDPDNGQKDLIPDPMKTKIYLTREGLTYLTTASGLQR